MARNTKLDNTAAPQEVLPVADDDRPNIVRPPSDPKTPRS